MIPRTKVNYNLKHLMTAFLVHERGRDYRCGLAALLKQYMASEHVLLMPSGRAGLYFILKAIEKPRVIIPAYTCNAVVEAAGLAGKEIERVEIEPGGVNMPLAALEKVVDRQSVVIATHQFGIPCDIGGMRILCRERGALLIEDAAASFGTRVKGQLTGSFGDAAFFSFDSTKLINVPLKGGFISSRDKTLFGRIESLYREEIRPMPPAHKVSLLFQAAVLLAIENHLLYKIFHWLLLKSRGKYTAETAEVSRQKTPFYLYDMANWQAYIASAQVERIEEIIRIRQERYARFREKLKDCRGFELPPEDTEAEWACIRFPIRVKGDKFRFYEKAVERGIDFAFSFTFLACPEQYKAAHELAARVLDIPFYNKLTDSELDRVVAVLRSLDNEAHHES